MVSKSSEENLGYKSSLEGSLLSIPKGQSADFSQPVSCLVSESDMEGLPLSYVMYMLYSSSNKAHHLVYMLTEY